MSRPRTGHVESHGDGWRFSIRVNGERIRQSYSTREEAEAALAATRTALERDYAGELARKIGVLTVAELVEQHLERRDGELEASTLKRYRNVFECHILPRIGDLDARLVAETPLVLERFLLTDVPWGSARKAVEVLRPAFQWAVDNGLLMSNPVARIRLPKKPKRRKRKDIPTPEQVQLAIDAASADDPLWGLFVRITATLGLRRAETCALRWEDFDCPAPGETHGTVHIRRAIGKAVGTYVKLPKSGYERDVIASRGLFAALEPFRRTSGWLFPGRSVQPRASRELTPDSTPGRLLLLLAEQGGELSSSIGTAGADARRALGINSASFCAAARELVDRGLLHKESNARRTFLLRLTDAGRHAATDVALMPSEAKPWHPDTAGHRFEKLAEAHDLRAPGGKPYTLHSLRHYVATHLYNQSKDWVQVAKYLGHTSPAITMELYANNVIEDAQLLLSQVAERMTRGGAQM